MRFLVQRKKCIARRVLETPALVRKEVVFVVVVGIYLQNALEILVGECPRKALQSATRMALAARLADEEGTLRLVESLDFDTPKTSSMVATLNSLGMAGKTVLVSSDAHDGNLWKSARNIQGVTVSPVAELKCFVNPPATSDCDDYCSDRCVSGRDQTTS